MEVSRRESFSDTDEPSLESRVADNLKGVLGFGARWWLFLEAGLLFRVVFGGEIDSAVFGCSDLVVSDTLSEID